MRGPDKVDQDFRGYLYAEDPDPVAPWREPQRHEQQTRGRPDDDQLLRVLAQRQSQDDEERVQRREHDERGGAPNGSNAHEIPDWLGFAVATRRGRHRNVRDLPDLKNRRESSTHRAPASSMYTLIFAGKSTGNMI